MEYTKLLLEVFLNIACNPFGIHKICFGTFLRTSKGEDGRGKAEKDSIDRILLNSYGMYQHFANIVLKLLQTKSDRCMYVCISFS